MSAVADALRGCHGGARECAGRPKKEWAKKAYSVRMTRTTVDRVEKFAAARGLSRNAALEEMLDEYALILDGHILPPGWRGTKYPRPGLRTILKDVRR